MRASLTLRLTLALLVALLSAGASAQTVLYVDADATGNEDGSSWADAYEELDEALEDAASGSEIWVAAGTYFPTDDPDRDASFKLKSGVAVLGGFDGTETSADQRTLDPEEGGTILSGDIGVQGDESDNSYHVVTAVGVDGTAVLDGFVITGGNASTGSGFAATRFGGGLTNWDGVSLAPDTEGYPTLRNLVFQDNSANFGGGMFLNDAVEPVVLEDIEFKRNRAVRGGGLYSEASFEAEGVEFEENEASERGGGLFLLDRPGWDDVTVVLRDVEFDGNVVFNPERFASTDGGGFQIEGAVTVTIIDAEFERNRVESGDGGGLGVGSASTVDIVNAVFVGNVARTGAAIATTFQNPTLSLTNVVVAGNQGDEDMGSVIEVTEGSELTMAQVTVAGNDGFATLRVSDSATVEIVNAIVWDNDGVTLAVDGSSSGEIDIEDSIIEGGFPDGESILDVDPRFLRAPDDGPDDEWGTDDDDYGDLRLRFGSPALDTGDTGDVPLDEFDLDDDGDTAEILPVDLDGGDRVQSGRVDLGAYEGAFNPVSAETGAPSEALALSASAPNPTRGRASLSLTLATAGHVQVSLFDALGRRVARLLDAPLAAGGHTVEIDGAALPAGLYIVRAASASGTATQRLTVVR